MKKMMSFLMAGLLILSLCACAKSNTNAENTSAANTAAPSATAAAEAPVDENSPIDDAAWDELESLGKVQTENGIFYVTITVPADLAGEGITQAELYKNAAEGVYTSAKLNSDGSVTYKLTKKQHKAMLDEFTKSIDDGLQEMVDSSDYAFTKIMYNANMTSFDAYLSTNEVGFAESFMTLGFYMYGGFYSIFSGKEADNIQVNFYGPDGNLISTANSSEMG